MADERIFDIPEDDYDALDNSDDDEQKNLPFHPVPSSPISNEHIRNACCTCLNTTATHMFVPCGHLCICNDCEQRLEDKKCPLCREEYINCIRVIIT